MKIGEKYYIGDGVYAHFDGFQFWLETHRTDGIHSIALDYETYCAFVKLTKEVWNEARV